MSHISANDLKTKGVAAIEAMLSEHSEVRTVTMSDATAGARDTLDRLAPGSWAGGDFYIWIGHADDRRAWSQLADARVALGVRAV